MAKFEVHWVRWVDAEAEAEWKHFSKIDMEVIPVETVGIVVKENDEMLVLGLSFDPTNNEYNGLFYIPKGMVLSRSVVLQVD
ncbi:MAG TPA: hypothetical protein VEF04_09535 [Blastocatellia bacterium]|nr:hypothetical protein [Blastocatellia bacterium]